MKKDIIKVSFDGERFKEYIQIADITVKDVAANSGCSDTTIRKAAKKGEINQDYISKIAEYLVVDVAYLQGDKAEKYVRLAKAVKKAIKALNELNAALCAE